MKRRDFLKLPGVLGISSLAVQSTDSIDTARAYDVLVVGAGVFGIWTASYLHRAGKRVAVIDSVGPAHSAATSGGESRVTRCGYGAEDLYTDGACRSMEEWRALSERAALPLVQQQLEQIDELRDDLERLQTERRVLSEVGHTMDQLDDVRRLLRSLRNRGTRARE